MPRRRALRPDDLLRICTVTDPQISPDGARVAFVVTAPDVAADKLVPGVWVAAIDGEGDAVPFATDDGQAHSPRWSPDGKWLAFVSDRAGRAKPQLWVAPLAGGEPRCLTDTAHGVAAPVWSPDGTRMAYITRVGGRDPVATDAEPAAKNAPRVVRHLSERLDGFGWLDGRAHLFAVDVGGGDPVQLTDGEFDNQMPAWSPDGTSIAVVSDREPGNLDRYGVADIWVVPADGGRARKVTASSGPVAHPAWSPDGNFIAYSGNDAGDRFWSAVSDIRVVAADGSAGPRSLTSPDHAAGGRLLLDGRVLAWHPDGTSVLFVAVAGGTVQVQRVTVAGGRVTTVVGGDRAVTAFDIAADGRHVAFLSRYADHLPDVRSVRLGRGRAEERVVHDPNAEVRDEVFMVTVERRTHVAADGREIESFVLRPPKAKKKEATPLVLDVHGGPHGFHPSTSVRMSVRAQIEAASGYTVVMPNPRGSAGYGAEFLAACVGDWGGADYDDLIGAVDSCVDAGQADPDDLHLFGYSYGGFMSSWIVGHTGRFRSAVIGAPVTDLVSMTGTTDIPGFAVHEQGGLPWERSDEYGKRSPITYLPDVTTPVLVIHHEGDLRCPIGQGEELFALLRLLGKEAEMVRYPGGFHGIATPSQLVDQTERILGWYEAHR